MRNAHFTYYFQVLLCFGGTSRSSGRVRQHVSAQAPASPPSRSPAGGAATPTMRSSPRQPALRAVLVRLSVRSRVDRARGMTVRPGGDRTEHLLRRGKIAQTGGDCRVYSISSVEVIARYGGRWRRHVRRSLRLRVGGRRWTQTRQKSHRPRHFNRTLQVAP